MSEHTPTPWQRSGVRCHALISGTRVDYHSIGPDSDPIAFVAYSDRTPALHRETLSNAEFIVKAVNNHDALVKALRLARARIEYLGAACPDPRHFTSNAGDFLPLIDEALAHVEASKVSDDR